MKTPSARSLSTVFAVGVAAAAGALVVRRMKSAGSADIEQRTGTSTNGIEYWVAGTGPRTMLQLQGGPGSQVQGGWMRRLMVAGMKPYLQAGYQVWQVTRARHMPAGHTVADMADDCARFIREQMGGRVDVVYGLSYGGMIALYLAANHPDLVGRVVLAFSAAAVSDAGKDLDSRMATAAAEGRHADAGAAGLEFMLPGERWRPLRRVLAWLAGRVFAPTSVPPGDLLVERDAELAFDGREAASRIQAPVLILAAGNDLFFPSDVVAETAELIPDCTVFTYPGFTHMQGGMSSRTPADVLEWLGK